MQEETKKFNECSASEKKSCASESCIALILTLLCFLIITIHFTASFFPKGRIWGINQWAYFSFWITFPVTFLTLLFFLPSFNRFILNAIKTLISPLFEWMVKKKYLWYSILSVIFFILFWAFRTKTHFLGDGYQILSNVESHQLAIKWTEFLESFLHLKAFLFAKNLFNWDAETVYALLSCLAGSIFVFLCFLFVDLLVHTHFLDKERSQRVFVFLSLISLGSTQLFFGYVEHYTFLFLSIFGFLFLSIVYLVENPALGEERNPKNYSRTKLIFPLLTFVLAFSFHVSALCLLPSLFFLFFVTNEKSKPSRCFASHRVKNLLLGILALFLVIIIFWGYRRYSWSVPPLFVPLSHDRYSGPGYTLFSLPHLSDFLNQQFLISPVGLILILAFLICKRRSFFMNRTSQFLLIVALSQLLFNFLMDPALGASRDWDMFSGVGLGYTILGLYLLLEFLKEKTKFEYLATILVVTSLYSTIPWIALNSCKPKTIERFRNLLLIDPKKSQNGHFVLFRYFKALGQEEDAEKENQVQRKVLPELPLIAEGRNFFVEGKLDSAEAKLLLAKEIAPGLATVHNDLGMVYFAQKELNKAEIEYKQAIKLGSFMAIPYFNLGNLYMVEGNKDSALEFYRKAVFLKCEYPEAYSNLGYIYFLKGDLDQAENLFKRILKLKPDFQDAYMGLGDIYRRRGKFQEAIKVYQTAIQLKPDLANAHLRLGMIYLQIQSKDEAIRELEIFLKLAPQAENAEEVRNILQKLRP
jgi:Flp pilus assembly protein TadD